MAIVTGTANSEFLYGLDYEDDVITGDLGNDTLVGWYGTDTAIYNDSSSGFTFSLNNGAFTVTDTNASNGDEGIDTLVSIEKLQFSDANISVSPPTDGFHINTYTNGFQAFTDVARLSGGGFVVTWWSGSQDPDGSGGIYAQRYDAAANPVGGEFRVNTTTDGNQISAQVSALSDGGFMVVWQADSPPGSALSDIYAQRYASNGSAVGNEITVNTTGGSAYDPVVQQLTDGGFVIAWDSQASSGSDSYGIYAQRYAANGSAVGTDFLVNSYTTGRQYGPAIASLTNGGFVITWNSTYQDGSYEGVYGQLYGSNGNTLGSEFRINTTTSDDQFSRTVAGLSNGGFVVAWESYDQDGSGYGIYAQRYQADGTPIGGEVLINTTTSGNQRSPNITTFTNGDYLINWVSGGDQFGQRFHVDGSRVGGEFQINHLTPGTQPNPSAADFIGAWSALDDRDQQAGIFGQAFDTSGNALAAHLTTTINGDANANTLTWIDTEAVILDGSGGNDILIGGTGNDQLIGGSGDDTLTGSAGADVLDGGVGTDAVSYASASAGIQANLLTGTGALNDAAGDTYINIENLIGSNFSDTLTGNASANTLSGGPGADSLDGGAGFDTTDYSTSASGVQVFLSTGLGAGSGGDAQGDLYTSIEGVIGSGLGDVLVGAAGVANTLSGGGGDDVIYGEGLDTVSGGNGNDVFFGGQGGALNLNLATANLETVWGSVVADTLDGSASSANLVLIGQGGADTLIGGAGNDFFYFDQLDSVAGGAGNDWAVASLATAGVTLHLNAAALENAWGSPFDDVLDGAGASATQVLVGDTGNDTLTGGSATDFLYGQDGNDVLAGGGGTDILMGGNGNDAFVFSAPSGQGTDLIYDFTSGVDHLQLSASGFGVAPGTVLTDGVSFVSGASPAAAAATPTLLYDTASGMLSFDADGSGASTAASFALLVGHPALHAADFAFA